MTTNADSSGTDLIMLYFQQLDIGCDKIKCKNPFCAHCPNFKFPVPDDNINLWDIATKLAANHQIAPKLCKTMKSSNLDEAKQTILNDIRAFATTKVHNAEKARNILNLISADRSIFANLLNSNNLPLSLTNSRIDDNLLYEFSDQLSKIGELDNDLLQFVSSYAQYILKTKNFFNYYSKLRTLLILFYFPAIISPDIRPPILIPLIKHIATNLKGLNYRIFCTWISHLSSLRRQMLGFIHTAISTNFAEHPKESLHSDTYHLLFKTMSFIHIANTESNDPISIQNFYDEHVNRMFNVQSEIDLFKNPRLHGKSASILKKYPFVLSLMTKSQVTKYEANENMILMAQHSMEHSLSSQYTNEKYYVIKASRENLVRDAYSQLINQDRNNFLKKMKVEFSGEKAIDAGGPSRDFIFNVTQKLLDPKYKMFKVVNNRYHWITGKGNKTMYKLFGMIVGLAIHNSILLPIRFPLVLYKRLLSPEQPLLLNDLKEIDPTTVNSLSDLLKRVKNEQDISEVGLCFCINTGVFGDSKPHDVPLDPNIDKYQGVVNSNFELYIEKYLNYRLVERIREPFDAFRQGFETTCVASTYKLLDPEELDILVTGVDMYDWTGLKNNAIIDKNHAKSKFITWFWQIFDNFTKSEKLLFLQFVTGTDRAPIGGLSSLKITIKLTKKSTQLPISHTCFYRFDLPKYETLDIMNEKVKLAIKYCDGFGLK